jgi:hypothetical protein
LHGAIDDFPGAIGCYDQTIAIFEHLSAQGKIPEDRIALARSLSDKCLICERMSDARETLSLSDRALNILREIRLASDSRTSSEDFARLLLRKALVLTRSGCCSRSIRFFLPQNPSKSQLARILRTTLTP